MWSVGRTQFEVMSSTYFLDNMAFLLHSLCCQSAYMVMLKYMKDIIQKSVRPENSKDTHSEPAAVRNGMGCSMNHWYFINDRCLHRWDGQGSKWHTISDLFTTGNISVQNTPFFKVLWAQCSVAQRFLTPVRVIFLLTRMVHLTYYKQQDLIWG